MRKRRPSRQHFVNHPHHGASPHNWGKTVPEAEIRQSFWRLRDAAIFPESALIARSADQNCGISPRPYYVDIVRTCRSCARKFIFFAVEQQYWFETRGFNVNSDCVDCPECRRQKRLIKRRLDRYSRLMKQAARTEDEMRNAVDDASFLFERGVLSKLTPLGALKNEALRAIPSYPGTIRLGRLLARAKKA